ncbi:OSGEP threonylcarbamoyltransferase, partial [Campylorhamphus procurvoides]|nr:OSGEP threonylcarbamoyltransferase [Campylorhamphus procurvoides]
QVISFSRRRYRILGETLDVAVGNCIDRLARLLKIPNDPSPGYNVEQLAKRIPPISQNPSNLPKIPRIPPKPQAVTPKLLESGEATPEDLCFSLQETVFAMLTEVTERALALTRSVHLLLVGGVAC